MRKKQTKISVKKFFENDAKDYLRFKYRESNESFMSLRHEASLNLLEKEMISEISSGSRILDAGCGPGLFLQDLLFTGARLYGLDISSNMLKLARSHLKESMQAVTFISGDIERLPFKDNSFDLIVSLGVIEYLKADECVLSEFHRCLRPKGHLLVGITNKYSYNLAFDAALELLKDMPSASYLLSKLKERFGLGKVKKRDFRIRKQSPSCFASVLKTQKFQEIKKVYFGFNIFPYPFNYFVPRLNRAWVNLLVKSNAVWVSALSEGCIFFCKRI